MSQRLLDLRIGIDLKTEVCCNCGVLFAMPTELQEKRKQNGDTFYCPNGHPQHYTEATEVKLRRTEERLREAQAHSSSLRNQLEGALKQVSVHKGLVTRIKNRIRKGVCPCCRRHFANLQNHMETEHPDYNSPERQVSNGT